MPGLFLYSSKKAETYSRRLFAICYLLIAVSYLGNAVAVFFRTVFAELWDMICMSPLPGPCMVQ